MEAFLYGVASPSDNVIHVLDSTAAIAQAQTLRQMQEWVAVASPCLYTIQDFLIAQVRPSPKRTRCFRRYCTLVVILVAAGSTLHKTALDLSNLSGSVVCLSGLILEKIDSTISRRYVSDCGAFCLDSSPHLPVIVRR